MHKHVIMGEPRDIKKSTLSLDAYKKPNEKVTKISPNYPEGQEPNIIIPAHYDYYRYLIGHDGKKPLFAIGMNPSAAREESSDRTVNRIIKASVDLGYDGWFVANIYPERATDAANLSTYDPLIVYDNIITIRNFLREHHIKEVWGAWGECNIKQLTLGRDPLLRMLMEEGINVFAFGLNKSGNPKHPLYLKIITENKVYLDIEDLLSKSACFSS